MMYHMIPRPRDQPASSWHVPEVLKRCVTHCSARTFLFIVSHTITRNPQQLYSCVSSKMPVVSTFIRCISSHLKRGLNDVCSLLNAVRNG
ncbi:hypothetical protein RB195_020789 [Necator americanus]|uniref:Uncharacterized protein n=1 Tax=Necator americanus TaxID=51031 RepID=A0ABR1CLP6_NECAM